LGSSPLLSFLFLVGGFVLLCLGAEFLLRGSVRVARRFGLSDLVIGATLVALGTSAPELFVSVAASFHGHPAMALGNVAGSNLCNVFLVLGAAALFSPIPVLRKRHLPMAGILFGISLLVLALALWGRALGRVDGVLLLLLLVFWTLFSLKAPSASVGEEIPRVKTSMAVAALLTLGGLFLLWLGSKWTVKGAVALAVWLGVQERVVAVSVVALGTSLPELATSLLASFRKSPDIALGNVVGSNIFNLLCILGAAALAAPIPVPGNSVIDLGLVVGASLLVLLPVLFFRRIGRRWGVLLLVLYAGLMTWLFLSGRV